MPQVTQQGTARKRRRTKPATSTTPTTAITDQTELPFNMVIHGIPSVGKTSFAANAPKPHFLIDRQERGVLKLQKRKLISRNIPVDTADDWDDLLSRIRKLNDPSAPYKTLVLDSLTGFEKFCFAKICETDFDGKWEEFYNYTRGPKQAAKREWPALLDALTDLADSGKNVILIAHSYSKNFSNPEGPDYNRWIPYLDPETWTVTFRWSEYTLFMNYHTAVEKKGMKFKASASSGRFINLKWTPTYDAKCLAACMPSVDMGDSGKEAWTNFAKEVRV